MRLSDGDRDRLLERLKAHAVAGAIDSDELERRVELVARALDREQAEAAFSDLPELEAAGPAPSSPRPRWRRGHGEADVPELNWEPTPERFRDPRTGVVMRVWLDGAGGRHYVPDRPA